MSVFYSSSSSNPNFRTAGHTQSGKRSLLTIRGSREGGLTVTSMRYTQFHGSYKDRCPRLVSCWIYGHLSVYVWELFDAAAKMVF